ncbi:MAG: type II secretion system protein [Acholeplasmataceae bacterium]
MLEKRGFTLVELIVVIAVIAVLSAVSIVGFSSFLEQARFSNDNQLAVQMTELIELYDIENPDQADEPIDADGIRAIVNAADDNDFDFVPESTNAGFFFMEEERRIIIAEYEDISDPEFEIAGRNVALLSDPVELDSEDQALGDTPEELFGPGKHLLTTRGNVVADVVRRLRELASLPEDQVSAAYDDIKETIENDSLFDRIFANGVPKERLNTLADRYTPEETVFVDNYGWRYQERQLHYGWTAKRMLFAPDIVNIPKYDGPRTTVREEINLPSTVRTIEADAFTNFVTRSLSFNVLGRETIYAEEGAFREDMDRADAFSNQGRNIVFDHEFPEESLSITIERDGVDETLNYPESADDLNLDNVDSIKVDITSLPRAMIEELVVRVADSSIEVRIYGQDGLLGVTRVPVTYDEPSS